MKTVTIYDFTRYFSRHCRAACQVRKRGKVVGVWQPHSAAPEPVDIAARQKADGFAQPLPFTGAALLKEGKKR